MFVNVGIIDDNLNEENETFFGTLKSLDATPDNVLIGAPSRAVATIIDDDPISKCTSMLNIISLAMACINVNLCIYVCIHGFVFIVVVQFLNDTSSALESAGVMAFTVISLVRSDRPFSVQVCTRETNSPPATGLL